MTLGLGHPHQPSLGPPFPPSFAVGLPPSLPQIRFRISLSTAGVTPPLVNRRQRWRPHPPGF